MSLTSHLADKSSPVHRFFAENFPEAGPARAALLPTSDAGVVAGRYDPEAAPRRPAWRLAEPRVVPPDESRVGYPWDTVGTAFDYRVRFFFPSREGDHRVAYEGASKLMNYWASQFAVPLTRIPEVPHSRSSKFPT